MHREGFASTSSIIRSKRSCVLGFFVATEHLSQYHYNVCIGSLYVFFVSSCNLLVLHTGPSSIEQQHLYVPRAFANLAACTFDTHHLRLVCDIYILNVCNMNEPSSPLSAKLFFFFVLVRTPLVSLAFPVPDLYNLSDAIFPLRCNTSDTIDRTCLQCVSSGKKGEGLKKRLEKGGNPQIEYLSKGTN